MYVSLSEWSIEVRSALPKKKMNLQSVSKKIGHSYTVVVALLSGRVVKSNYLDIAKKINEVLDVQVLPEKPPLPSNEWCGEVRAKLYLQKMNMIQLSKAVGFNRDRLSLVLNGHAMDEPVIEKINEVLKIEVPVFPTGAK